MNREPVLYVYFDLYIFFFLLFFSEEPEKEILSSEPGSTIFILIFRFSILNELALFYGIALILLKSVRRKIFQIIRPKTILLFS